MLGYATDAAQGFTTGSHAGGYLLTGIDIRFRVLEGEQTAPSVTLHSGSPTAPAIATLSGPATVDDGVERFTASGKVRLDADTTYFVRLEGATLSVGVRSTPSEHEDSGGSAGWSIDNTAHWRLAASSGSFTAEPGSLLIRVSGTATGDGPRHPAGREADRFGQYRHH